MTPVQQERFSIKGQISRFTGGFSAATDMSAWQKPEVSASAAHDGPLLDVLEQTGQPAIACSQILNLAPPKAPFMATWPALQSGDMLVNKAGVSPITYFRNPLSCALTRKKSKQHG